MAAVSYYGYLVTEHCMDLLLVSPAGQAQQGEKSGKYINLLSKFYLKFKDNSHGFESYEGIPRTKRLKMDREKINLHS